MIIYISEVIGTFMFVYLLLSIIANAICSSENNKISLLTTSIGVGLAYVVPCILFGEVSGAHFNPIITIATSVFDVFEIRFMWGYIIAEAIGAFLASVLYIVFFKSKYNTVQDAIKKIKLFSVYPDNKNILIIFLKEMMASFILLFGMLGVTFVLKGVTTESIYILYFLIIVAVGLAFDYTTVATNPFRIIFTSLFYLILPFNKKEKIKISYVFVAIVAPIVGAMLAVVSFQSIPWG